ncbi:hypothetical protein ACFQ9X_09515 [Catenulispora yoronensis]
MAPGVRRILTGEFGRVLELVASPDGRHLAATTRDNKLLLIGVEAGTLRVVADGDGTYSGLTRWGIPFASDPAFSPDSRWLAWSQRSGVADAWQIRAADVATLTGVDITEPRFRDWNPVFTTDGKHLAFLSARTFDTYPEELVYDFSFLPAVRPYLVPLAESEPSPFDPELGGGRSTRTTPGPVRAARAGPAAPAAPTPRRRTPTSRRPSSTASASPPAPCRSRSPPAATPPSRPSRAA